MSNLSDNKFKDQKVTADGSNRAFIEARNIKTLWFNTGTLCNIECKNCYIESSPKNDSLAYLTFDEVKSFIDEAIDKNLGTNEIGFTGGEPFMNKDIMKMIDYSLRKHLKVLVLSNAMKPMLNRTKELIKLNHSNLTIRVSIDHYEKEKHEEIRGKNTYDVMLQGLKWLNENNFITLTYGLKRTGLETSNFLDHLKFPSIFILKQLVILLPFFGLVYLLINKFKLKLNLKDKKLLFLVFINLLPILLMLLTSMITGSRIRTMWMTPFYLFFGVFAVYLFKNQINLKKLNSFLYGFVFLVLLSPILYSYISVKQTNKRTDYFGKEIADLVERRWNKNFSNEIMYVVGDEWFAGNLSYHLPSRPKWFLELKDKVNSLDPNGGIIYVGNPEVLKKICPGDFGQMDKHGYCMIGSR